MLLKKSNITKQERMLVLTGLDYEKKDQLYEQAKRSLMKFKGEQGGGLESRGDQSMAIKLEPTFLAENEEALWSVGYVRRGGRNRAGSRPWQRNNQPYWNRSKNYGNANNVADDRRGTRSTNPKGPDGKPLLCRSCGSFRHLIAKCPDSWENRATVNIAEQMEKEQSDDAEAVLFTMFQPSGMNDMEEVILLTGLNENNVKQIGMEARKCAVLDIACSSTVCGEHWLEDYLNSLNSEERKKASRTDNCKIFKFGGEQLRSEGLFKIPAVVAGKETFINTDMVKSDIPLLLSKRSMKQAGAKLNLQNDTAIFGVKVTLNETSSGHYCIPIDKEKTTVESICAVNIEELSSSDKFKTLVTLQRQFAHPPEG